MTARAEVRISCESAVEAQHLLGAVAADDDLQCQSRREGAQLVALLEGPDVASLLRAVDDLLACLSVAEDVIKKP